MLGFNQKSHNGEEMRQISIERPSLKAEFVHPIRHFLDGIAFFFHMLISTLKQRFHLGDQLLSLILEGLLFGYRSSLVALLCLSHRFWNLAFFFVFFFFLLIIRIRRIDQVTG